VCWHWPILRIVESHRSYKKSDLKHHQGYFLWVLGVQIVIQLYNQLVWKRRLVDCRIVLYSFGSINNYRLNVTVISNPGLELWLTLSFRSYTKSFLDLSVYVPCASRLLLCWWLFWETNQSTDMNRMVHVRRATLEIHPTNELGIRFKLFDLFGVQHTYPNCSILLKIVFIDWSDLSRIK
jgi:hypothetical protein